MTGAEIGVIAGAAAKAAGALSDDARAEAKTDRAAIREAAKGSVGLEKAGELYGQRMAVKQAILNKIWSPLARFFGVAEEYFANDFARDLATRLENVPEEDLATPKASVVAPAIQALGYSLDEPNLKDLYLNLLAAASTKSRADDVHPSFVDMVRHLSSEEAAVLPHFLAPPRVECARLKITLPTGGFITRHEYVVQWVSGPTRRPELMPQIMTAWVNNWERLGLIQPTYEEHGLSSDPSVDLYSWVRERPEFTALEGEIPVVPEGEASYGVTFDKGLIKATALGRAFYKAVGEPKAVEDAS